MIFGRKNRPAKAAGVDEIDPVDATDHETAAAASENADQPAEISEDAAGALPTDDAVEEADAEGDDPVSDDTDARADGPFDVTEVDLAGDTVDRLELGAMTITPFDGMGLQFQGNPETQEIYSALVMHENSGLQLELFAAPTTGGLAGELREDMLEETQQAGGNAELQDGPFGREIKRVLPMEGSEGEQLFHVSRIWLVDGPRWLLRGTLMGQASLAEGEEAPADVFVEFFRNIVVHRDDSPRVPGELLTLQLPDMPMAQG